jgi:uncharacterized protein GlcG (DUF336 family)
MKLDVANHVVNTVLARASELGLQPLAVVVLDAGGHVVALQRQDNASNKRADIAYGKAHGALSLGVGSRALMARAEQQPYFIAAATAAVGGALIPLPGGVLVRTAGGDLVGAVGVSGDASDNDERVAAAGIEAAGLTAQPA